MCSIVNQLFTFNDLYCNYPCFVLDLKEIKEKETKKETKKKRRGKKRKEKLKKERQTQLTGLGELEDNLRSGGQDRDDLQRFLCTVMIRPLCLTTIIQKEGALSLLRLCSGQQHALLFVFQMPLWVRPLVYAQSACYNFPFSAGLCDAQRNVK